MARTTLIILTGALVVVGVVLRALEEVVGIYIRYKTSPDNVVYT